MRKQDIRLGVLYALQDRSWATPQPMVFLSATLYRERWWGDDSDSPEYVVAEGSYNRPQAARPTYGPAVGYPVLTMGSSAAADQYAVLLRIKPIAVTVGLAQKHLDAGVRLQLLTRMASVPGYYDEIMKLRAQHEETNRRANTEHVAKQNRLMLQRDDLAARLEVLGIEVLRDYRHDDRLSFKLDELEMIITRLEKAYKLRAEPEIW
jgi:hypothetical protein